MPATEGRLVCGEGVGGVSDAGPGVDGRPTRGLGTLWVLSVTGPRAAHTLRALPGTFVVVPDVLLVLVPVRTERLLLEEIRLQVEVRTSGVLPGTACPWCLLGLVKEVTEGFRTQSFLVCDLLGLFPVPETVSEV